MKKTDAAASSSALQNLPSVDEILRTGTGKRLAAAHGLKFITRLARQAVDGLRTEVRDAAEQDANEIRMKADLLSAGERRLESELNWTEVSRIRRVINATGVVIHTNLGRAPLSENACRAIVEAAGYATVEYDIPGGTRGKRGSAVESLICEVTGAEAAIVVNNCAAAAFLVLGVLASGGEVLVSRGELVEIGGDFRVPDVLMQSGARLREVGTTNRTRLADYEKAINSDTKMILKVHPSNYRIIGFSAAANLTELAAMAKSKGLILYEDAGSGALIDLSRFGLRDEPVIADSIAAGADLVTFSGDKLLGGPQAGLIAGNQEFVEKIRKHPLYRALRVDKIVYAALEATLESFRREKAAAEIPVLKMISMTKVQLAERATRFSKKIDNLAALKVEIIDGKSAVGGGAAPDFQPETALLSLTHAAMPAERIEYALRHSDPPVIARIVEGKVLLDLRTVSENEETELIKILSEI
jgi:L-seryl-tRNA(Ser) seleniumtransferase